jgi:hypothetical protein
MPLRHIPLPAPDTLKRYFRYDEETGELFWRAGVEIRPGFVRRYEKKAGSKAYPDQNSYMTLRFLSKAFMVHRIIWCLVTGNDPCELEIDHVNGIKDDNRWSNLRLATHDNNNQNTKIQKNNSSGFKGVAWHNQRKCWRAYVSVGPRGKSKQISLGLHDTAEKAAAAVRAYREKLHKEFHNHG